MSAWDTHKTLSEYSAYGTRNIREALDELRKRLLDEAPDDDARDAVQSFMEVLDGTASDEWGDTTYRLLRDAVPPEDDPGYCENPRREHGTYFTSNGMRAA